MRQIRLVVVAVCVAVTTGFSVWAESPKADLGAPSQADKLVPFQSNRPKLVAVYPGDGAKDVEPVTELRLRFDQPMDPFAMNISWKEGGYQEVAQPQYLQDKHEFVIPIRLAPGCDHRVVINQEPGHGGPAGFMSTDGVAVNFCEWRFTTQAPAVSATLPKPRVVSVSPASGPKVSRIVPLRIRFDQPMDRYGIKWRPSDRVDWWKERIQLSSLMTYSAERHEFVVPVVLPVDWEGQLELGGFRSEQGIEADPIELEYATGKTIWADAHLDELKQAGRSPMLREVIQKTRQARKDLRSVSETVYSVMSSGDCRAGRFSGLKGQAARFKMQGDRQFYGDVTQIMSAGGPFIVGSDGKECWFYANNRPRDGRYELGLMSCPFGAVLEKDVLFCEPFGTPVTDILSMFKDRKIEYVGTDNLDGRVCHVIRSWTAQEFGKDDLGLYICQWWIDGQTYRPAQIISYSGGWRHASRFIYERVNEALPESEFRPPMKANGVRCEPEPLGEGYVHRWLKVRDGSDGRMSVRWGKKGPKGWSSSGLN